MASNGLGLDKRLLIAPQPDCAETILADAKVCKHCGYRFPPLPLHDRRQIGKVADDERLER